MCRASTAAAGPPAEGPRMMCSILGGRGGSGSGNSRRGGGGGGGEEAEGEGDEDEDEVEDEVEDDAHGGSPPILLLTFR